MNLESLIPLLKANGVTRFDGYGIKVELSHGLQVVTASPGHSPSGAELPKSVPGQPEPTMDLPGTNDAMNADQILNWSAPPGADSLPLPLTGEEPLPSA